MRFFKKGRFNRFTKRLKLSKSSRKRGTRIRRYGASRGGIRL